MDQETLNRILAGFKDAYGEGRSDFSDAYKDAREKKNLGREGTRIDHLFGTNPTFVRARELLGIANDEDVKERNKRNLGLSNDRAKRVGQVMGTIGADLTQDHTRGVYWLLNAAQATGNVINEEILSKVRPDLYESVKVKNAQGEPIPVVEFESPEVPKQNRAYQSALDAKIIDPGTGQRFKNVGMQGGYYTKRKYDPGMVDGLGWPSGIAINAGLGLLNPLGGSGGYEAAIPSKEDPTKTSNVLAEVGAKYLLGRTGNLLPYNDFVQERPDVSKGEYNAYKAFKWDKNLDLDITDGDFTLPTGIIKGTTDGIHGPELQFLGRSLPLLTTGLPFAGAVAGTAMGVARNRPGSRVRRKRQELNLKQIDETIRDGHIGGFAGLAAGGGIGLLLEEERRRRNGESNSRALDPEEAQVGF